MENLEQKLNTMTKNELVDLILTFCSQCSEIKEQVEQRFETQELNNDEQNIITKIKNKEQLTIKDNEYILSILNNKENIKIKTLIKHNNKFLSFLVNEKINWYFENIWKQYPRKIGKKEGLKAFTKLIEDKKYKELKECCEFVYKKVMYYKNYCEEHNTEEQYIMHFSTFCNSKRYL